MTKVELDELLRGVYYVLTYDVARNLEKVQAEFEKYIDVLEPLENVDLTRNMYTYIIDWLQIKSTGHGLVGFYEVAKMLGRAVDIVFPKAAYSCNIPPSKRRLYCPYCGRRLSDEGYHPQ